MNAGLKRAVNPAYLGRTPVRRFADAAWGSFLGLVAPTRAGADCNYQRLALERQIVAEVRKRSSPGGKFAGAKSDYNCLPGGLTVPVPAAVPAPTAMPTPTAMPAPAPPMPSTAPPHPRNSVVAIVCGIAIVRVTTAWIRGIGRHANANPHYDAGVRGCRQCSGCANGCTRHQQRPSSNFSKSCHRSFLLRTDPSVHGSIVRPAR